MFATQTLQYSARCCEPERINSRKLQSPFCRNVSSSQGELVNQVHDVHSVVCSLWLAGEEASHSQLPGWLGGAYYQHHRPTPQLVEVGMAALSHDSSCKLKTSELRKEDFPHTCAGAEEEKTLPQGTVLPGAESVRSLTKHTCSIRHGSCPIAINEGSGLCPACPPVQG